MADKIMAVLGLATLIAFLGVVVVFVPDLDLIVVVLVVSALAIYDFWRSFRDRRNNDRKG
jgi:membrane protein implicated in regulation of membrane protease activity